MARLLRRSAQPLRHLSAVLAACLALVFVSGCFRSRIGDQQDERPDPIQVRVKNDNFLDVNVFANVAGASRRLGMVTGNTTQVFLVDWLATGGQSLTINAVPIGGRGSASTGALNIGPGQMVDFRVAMVLNQSVVSVHEPQY
jgi:hypothetical protein